MKKILFQSLVASLLFSSVFILSLYITKAWSPDSSGLIAQTGDELTAQKWNQLVESTQWKIAPVDTNPFDINCERRMVTSTLMFHASYVSANQVLTYGDSTKYRDVLRTNKGQFSSGNGFTLLRLEYKCPYR